MTELLISRRDIFRDSALKNVKVMRQKAMFINKLITNPKYIKKANFKERMHEDLVKTNKYIRESTKLIKKEIINVEEKIKSFNNNKGIILIQKTAEMILTDKESNESFKKLKIKEAKEKANLIKEEELNELKKSKQNYLEKIEEVAKLFFINEFTDLVQGSGGFEHLLILISNLRILHDGLAAAIAGKAVNTKRTGELTLGKALDQKSIQISKEDLEQKFGKKKVSDYLGEDSRVKNSVDKLILNIEKEDKFIDKITAFLKKTW
ncbi:MAG: hypothetical protein CfP315_0889 [Candidatus Improbicoccus pseudotrichonymphae]|uniref:Uncharacterized protein n=1 Tax=Candidatus Improbicoccus pseudotrichonymphae TaxID=3033792 RepID=A0AA48IH65_9FIRM|nr:MAG: hypothetical protein CfP315_0889 [Candidatus Improbicoccus pseudotrichonymphae]